MSSPYKNMPECARFWFQAARGRAMVQKNYMRKARAERRRTQETSGTTCVCCSLVPFYVAQARRACRDWRQYRRNYLEARKDGY